MDSFFTSITIVLSMPYAYMQGRRPRPKMPRPYDKELKVPRKIQYYYYWTFTIVRIDDYDNLVRI